MAIPGAQQAIDAHTDCVSGASAGQAGPSTSQESIATTAEELGIQDTGVDTVGRICKQEIQAWICCRRLLTFLPKAVLWVVQVQLPSWPCWQHACSAAMNTLYLFHVLPRKDLQTR